MFDSLTSSFKSAINKIRNFDDEKSLKGALEELKKSLLKSDVHHKLVKTLLQDVEIKTKKNGIGKSQFLSALEETLYEILKVEGNQGFVFANRPPTVILMTGLQGSGKTTSTAKLANYLKQKNKKVMVVAADLQRLAAVEQLKQLASQVDVDIYYEDDSKDPVAIATNALKKAKSEFFDVLLIDSAGRLAIDKELMNELKRVKQAVEPFEVFYVADSLTGQDAVRSATTFKSEIGIDGVILTKFDGDSKGGIAISIANQINVPLRFIGIGEKIPDFEPFLPDRIVGRLLGAGDIEGLAEKVSSVINEKQAKDITRKIKKGAFTFRDFVEQLENISKLGNMKSIISMIPGLSQIPNIKDMDLDNSKDIKLLKAIINSMTPKERDNPDILTNSRRRRIAKGSGLTVIDVNRAIKQFEHAAKFAKKFSKKESMSQLLDMIKKSEQNPASMNIK